MEIIELRRSKELLLQGHYRARYLTDLGRGQDYHPQEIISGISIGSRNCAEDSQGGNACYLLGCAALIEMKKAVKIPLYQFNHRRNVSNCCSRVPSGKEATATGLFKTGINLHKMDNLSICWRSSIHRPNNWFNMTGTI